MMLGTPSRRSLLLHAGVVKVLLRCCDVLNEGLKLSAIDGLHTLLTGAGLPMYARLSRRLMCCRALMARHCSPVAKPTPWLSPRWALPMPPRKESGH